MSPELQVFILAMSPIIELNGSIPFALSVLHLPLWKAFLFSFSGNLVPVIALLIFLGPISSLLSKKFRFFEKFFSWLFERTRKRIKPEIERYGKIGLISFIALPTPFTGGWTGAIAAFLIKMPFKFAFPLISLGILINGGIILILSLAGVTVDRYFGWQLLIAIIVIIGIVYAIRRRRR